jgi:hypothetical protein
MNLNELCRKNGIDEGLVKLLSVFDRRLDEIDARAENIEKQLKPLYQAIILNSPNLRAELAERVLKILGYTGVPPTPAQTPSGGPVPPIDDAPPSVLAFNCQMCEQRTHEPKNIRVGGHHDFIACPQCAGKLSASIAALLS